MNADAELTAFKTEIDLRQYAASKGYQLDPRESWRGSAVMRLGGRGGDKIIIKRNGNGHYVFFSVRDAADNGTIIDFIQKREHVNLGAIRKELRPWICRPSVSSALLPTLPPLEKSDRDRSTVERTFATMSVDNSSAYLEVERGVPAEVIASDRFQGCFRVDDRMNVAFPHFDQVGLCGYELKNHQFTGFAPGGEKGLWSSVEFPRDRRLVICESAIECLSYAALFPDSLTRYASIGGTLNPKQPALLVNAISRMPPTGEIVAGMNADSQGRQLAGVVQRAFVEAKVPEARFTVDEPPRCKDWNDELCARSDS